MSKILYQNRSEAGKLLAVKLRFIQKFTDSEVVALPRGGVPVAYEISRYLNLPMKILSKKISFRKKNPTIILVDDSLFSGEKILKSIEFLKRKMPLGIIVSVPFADTNSYQKVKKSVSMVVCPFIFKKSFPNQQFYLEYPQISSREITIFLKKSKENLNNELLNFY